MLFAATKSESDSKFSEACSFLDLEGALDAAETSMDSCSGGLKDGEDSCAPASCAFTMLDEATLDAATALGAMVEAAVNVAVAEIAALPVISSDICLWSTLRFLFKC